MTQHTPKFPFRPKDPEAEIQSLEAHKPGFFGLAILLFCATAALVLSVPLVPFQILKRWFTFKTVCAWCNPQHRISGAPWVRNPKRVSHGMCKRAHAREMASIAESKAQRLHSKRREILQSVFTPLNRNR